MKEAAGSCKIIADINYTIIMLQVISLNDLRSLDSYWAYFKTVNITRGLLEAAIFRPIIKI
jgi:hypothetical protein